MLYQLSYAHHIAMQHYLCQSCLMAHPAGLEPATIRLEGGCSIQLSYGRLFKDLPDKCDECYRRPVGASTDF